MTDALILMLIFLAILNPVSGLLLWESMARYVPRTSPIGGAVAAGLFSFVVIAIVAALGESINDSLDITPPTFQIATGVLLIVSVLLVFAPARDHADSDATEDGGRYWPVIRMILWLASPAALAAAISYRIEFGLVSTLIGVALALALSVLVLARGRDLLARVPTSILAWAGRFIGAIVVVLAIDLIRRGVENV